MLRSGHAKRQPSGPRALGRFLPSYALILLDFGVSHLGQPFANDRVVVREDVIDPLRIGGCQRGAFLEKN
jgi:hypothetical protein